MCFFYAITPIHAGSEVSLGAVDLPIQREAHTGWPHVQASAVKGAMRAHFRKSSDHVDLINYIFGLDLENDGEKKKPKSKEGETEPLLPGAISVSDAKLLLFPVRSNIAPFVRVSCPAQLKRFKTDLDFVNRSDSVKDVPSLNEEEGIFLSNHSEVDKVILEDAVVNIKNDDEYANYFSDLGFMKELDIREILLVSDVMYKYLVENFTEIQTQIKIDEKTGVVQGGALRYEELLPSDSLLYSVIYFGDAVNGGSLDEELKAANVKEYVKSSINRYLQVGGDATLGRGICKVIWIGED